MLIQRKSPKSLLTLANGLAVTFLCLQDHATPCRNAKSMRGLILNPWPLFVGLHFDSHAIGILTHLWLTRGWQQSLPIKELCLWRLGRGAVKVFLGTRLCGKEPIRILHFSYDITLQHSRVSVYSSKEEFEKIDLNMKKKYRDCLVTKSSRFEGDL